MSPRLALLFLVLAAGCRSSAPYTVPAAALNSAAALGAALGQRAAGGCYATCTNGTVCNPNTGYCEAASAAEICDRGETGAVRCVPVMGVSRGAEGAERPPAPPVGLSPATGSVPPPPAEASPRPPEGR